MKHSIVLLLLAFGLALASAISGCSGLAVWQKGHYYHSEVADSEATHNVHSVAVYVFSDGEAVHKSKYNLGLTPGDWPGAEAVRDATFSPDSSNAGPSLELANSIAKELNERGYDAKVVTDLGHSHDVAAEQCLKSAKDAGFDGVFIAYYKGFTSWNESDYDKVLQGEDIHITTREGFLYIANGGFLDAKTGDQLWKNSYYGMVENAHTINFSGEPFVNVVPDAVVGNGAEDYLKAAPIAASILLDPTKYPKTTKAFPSLGEKQHRM